MEYVPYYFYTSKRVGLGLKWAEAGDCVKAVLGLFD